VLRESMPLSKKARLSVWASRLGVLHILEYLARRPCLVVLNYHRVADPESCLYDRGVIEATPAQFDEQMDYLKRRYHLVDLEEVCDYAEDPRRLRQCSVLVSFDDGYRDTHDVALPILKSHGVRAAFFLPTAFVGTTRVPWWDQIAFMVRWSSRDPIKLRYPDDVSISVSELGLELAIRRVLRIYKDDGTRDTVRFLSMLEDASGVEMPEAAHERLFVDWREVGSLAAAGMGLGSHSHTHELLAKGSAHDQLEECVVSRDLLRSKLGVEPKALAYPVGSRRSFSATTQRCLREAGYRVGFSYYGGVNTPHTLEPFDMKRIPLDRDESLSAFRLRAAIAGTTGMQAW